MPGILPESAKRRRITPRTVAGVLAGIFLCAVFWYTVHGLQDLIHIHPIAVLLFPLVGVLFMINVIPIVVFLSFEEEFGGLNPILPWDYIKICFKTFIALRENKWKVSNKDL
ncbi:hypothetical protein BSKO_06187 [Bryopsis sp. KO-2023]|nr:hypothetical protein BSKO_06187 [Bryopsis sp. KO-2023]